MIRPVICGNGVVLLYEQMEQAFNGIEIWLNFGTGSDPVDCHGMAHLIEHAIFTCRTKDDLYSYYNSYAKTNKDRLRIYAKAERNVAESALESLLLGIRDLNISDNEFLYQKQKVLFEIQHARNSPPLNQLQLAEKYYLSGTGYDRPTVGSESLGQADWHGLKEHEMNMLQSCGMVVSVAGKCNKEKLIQIIEKSADKMNVVHHTYFPHMNERFRKVADVPALLSDDGGTVIWPVYDSGKTNVGNWVCAEMLYEYIRYCMLEYPIQILKVDHLAYMLIAIYLPESNGSASLLYKVVRGLVETSPDADVFQKVKAYVHSLYASKANYPEEIALFNAQSYFQGLHVDLAEMIAAIDGLAVNAFEDYIRKMTDEENEIKVGALLREA